ncbi:MAG: sulfatase [Acutalibacter sp.]|jgi:arylsulfatase A-like enzyme
MKKPNIVMILIDDMGWRDLQCFGSTFYETPNIDALAAEGTVFTQAYASCPVCSPSRASLMTGKYPARVGLTHYLGGHDWGKLMEVPYVDHLPLEEYTLPKALRDNGYHTWNVGKWHLGEREYYPEHQGFEVNLGGCSWGHPVQGYFAPWGIETLPSDVPEGTYLTDYLTDRAVELIENNDGAPFFLYWSHYAVHTPIESKPEDLARFAEKARRMKLDQIDPFVEGETFPCWHKRKERVLRRLVQSDVPYAAMISNLDQNVGRLVQTLKERGEFENTIIVFTSDNGGLSTAEGSPTCNAPLSEGKGWGYEGGVRVPLIMVGPGIASHAICETPTITPDWYPTFLELAGLPAQPQQHVDGVSIAPLLRGESMEERPLFWHYPHYGNQGGQPMAAVRRGNYKLLKFFEDNHTELYDLSQDISESFNLAAQQPALAQELETLLDHWIQEVGGIIPQPNPGISWD